MDSEEKDGSLVVTLPSVVESVAVESLEAMVAGWLAHPAPVHVIDFGAVVSFGSTAYRPFVRYSRELRAAGRTLACTNVSAKILAQLKSDGMTSVFLPVAAVELFKLAAPFVDATKLVMDAQARIRVASRPAYLKEPGERLPTEIAGVISMTSTELTGSFALCFSRATFARIHESMSPGRREIPDAEIEDAAGEWSNVIFGRAKTVLNDQMGYSLEKALPSVLVGDGLVVRHPSRHLSRHPAIVLPFDSLAGPFHVEIEIDRG